MDLELSGEQTEALSNVANWYEGGEFATQPVYRLFGPAGTGKTSLARYIVDKLGIGVNKIKYAAYTGKAAHVLAQKGAEPSSTIHSLIYMPRAQAKHRLRELQAEYEQEKGKDASARDPVLLAKLDAQVRAEEQRLSNPSFLLRTPQESTLTGSELLVVDEVSMVNDQTASDLLGFGVPTLALGDPYQLPPVEGGGALIHDTPDTLLTEVHRSALDSPVTRIATAVRSSTPGQRGYGVTGVDGDSGRVGDLPMGALPEFDQVLVGTNRTRWDAIHMLRNLAGNRGGRPVEGDKIIAIANNGEADVLNGQMFTVVDVEHGRSRHELQVLGEDGDIRELAVWGHGFTGPDGERTARLMGTRGEIAAATFGAAITVHKAQGSQWRSVLLVDESSVFERMARGSRAQRYQAGQRWCYTGVTRASHRIVLCGSGVVRG